MSLSKRFEEHVSRGEGFDGHNRREIIRALEETLSSDYPQTNSRAGLQVKGLYKLYLDVCFEIGKEPDLVYTGSEVIEEDRLEELASQTDRTKEQVVNELEVQI